MLLKLRNWLIVKLAGKNVVAINLTIKNGAIVIDSSELANNNLLVNLNVSYCETGLRVKM